MLPQLLALVGCSDSLGCSCSGHTTSWRAAVRCAAEQEQEKCRSPQYETRPPDRPSSTWDARLQMRDLTAWNSNRRLRIRRRGGTARERVSWQHACMLEHEARGID